MASAIQIRAILEIIKTIGVSLNDEEVYTMVSILNSAIDRIEKENGKE